MLDKHPDVQPTLRAHLGSIDELICKALSNGFDVPESSFTSSCAQQPDGLEDRQGSDHKRVPVLPVIWDPALQISAFHYMLSPRYEIQGSGHSTRC